MNTGDVPPVYAQPGKANASKMENRMRACIRATIRTNAAELDQLLNIAGKLEYLVIDWHDFNLHNGLILRKAGLKGANSKTEQAVRLALRHDTSSLIFFDLWRELGQATRNLIAGSYESVFRSLRWMVEASVFWSDLQLDEPPMPKQFLWYYRQRDKLTKEEYERLFWEIHAVGLARFEDRLYFKEKMKRLSFGDLLNGLKFEGSSYPPNLKPDDIKNTLRRLFSSLSGYSHMTPDTIHEVHYEFLHGDFAFFQDYTYDKDMFRLAFDALWICLDSIVGLLVVVEAQFLGYDSPLDFIKVLREPHDLNSLIRYGSIRGKLPGTISTFGRARP